jgi:WD40 repeat protein
MYQDAIDEEPRQDKEGSFNADRLLQQSRLADTILKPVPYINDVDKVSSIEPADRARISKLLAESGGDESMALFSASAAGDCIAIQVLLKAGVSIDALDDRRRTVLSLAVANAHQDAAEMLMAPLRDIAGVDIRWCKMMWFTALDWAKTMRIKEASDILLKNIFSHVGLEPSGWTIRYRGQDLNRASMASSEGRINVRNEDWFTISKETKESKLSIRMASYIPQQVTCVRLSSDGYRTAMVTRNGIMVFEDGSGERIDLIYDPADKEYVQSLCFTADDLHIVAGGKHSIIYLWDILTMEIRHRFFGHTGDIVCLDAARSGNRVVSGSTDGTARVWNLSTGASLLTFNVGKPLTCVALSPSGTLMAAGSPDGKVRIWETLLGGLVDVVAENTSTVTSIAFCPKGLMIIAGSLDGTVRLYAISRTSNATPISDISSHLGGCKTVFSCYDRILDVSFSPNGAWVALATKDRGVQFFNMDGILQLVLYEDQYGAF